MSNPMRPAHGHLRTHHSSLADAIYEQCIWDQAHVEAIYPILKGLLTADGRWHEIALATTESYGLARYRVFREQSFQAIFAKSFNPVVEALTDMDPVQTEDDAEWAVWRLENGAGYALSSTFAVTPGPFLHQPEVDKWLWRHGLGLEPFNFYVEGVAYFLEIEPGCLRDAMDRLAWLESALEELRDKYEAAGRAFWSELKKESDTLLQPEDDSRESDEILLLPPRYPRTGPKQREPC
jgi:hypothetical protein